MSPPVQFSNNPEDRPKKQKKQTKGKRSRGEESEGKGGKNKGGDGRHYWALEFTLEAEHAADTLYVAHAYPYSYTRLR